MKRKLVLLSMFVLALLLFVLAGTTIAYLIDTTAEITNIFNPQNIDVALNETTGNTYDMVPGVTLTKDPTVTIDTDIACYVFVEITEQYNTWNNGTKDITVVNYTVDDKWTLVPGTTNVYYIDVAAKTNTSYSVIDGNIVSISTEITKGYMDGLETNNIQKPTITFKAYAVQKLNQGTTNFTPEAAWGMAK